MRVVSKEGVAVGEVYMRLGANIGGILSLAAVFVSRGYLLAWVLSRRGRQGSELCQRIF